MEAQLSSYLAFTHGDTGTVPETLLGLCSFVVIMSAGTQRGTKLIPVLSQSLQSHRSNDMLLQDSVEGAAVGWASP